MAKLLLGSVIVAIIAIPVLLAREPNPHRAVKNVVLLMFVFNLFYLLAVRFIYPRLQ